MFHHDDDLILNNNSPNRADALRNQQRVLRAAADLFARHGVDAVSMTQIAQEAGVGKGTLYRNFANKVELCYALLDQEQRDLQDATLRRLRQTDDARANLLWFLRAAVSFTLRNEDLLHAGADSGQGVALEVRAHLWWRQTIFNLLRQIGQSCDAEFAADTLYVMLHVNTIRFQRHTLGYTAERLTDGLLATAERLAGCGD